MLDAYISNIKWNHLTDNTIFGTTISLFYWFFLNIIEKEKENGLSEEIYEKAKENFLKRYETIDFNKYYLENPFQESCKALYHWSPIADELKTLDEKIVLNSMKLKWNLIADEFKNLTKKLYFN